MELNVFEDEMPQLLKPGDAGSNTIKMAPVSDKEGFVSFFCLFLCLFGF